MIGRTNAVGSSDLKHITGSFTTTGTSEQSSFSVTGVQFDAKVVFLYLESGYVSTYWSIPMILFIDTKNDAAVYMKRGQGSGEVIPGGGSLTQSGTTVTITAPEDAPFSTVSHQGYGTYTYHIYG